MGWFYMSNEERKGPVGDGQIYHLLRAGTITRETLLWKAGMNDWRPAAKIEELEPVLSSLPPEIPPAYPNRLSRAWLWLLEHLGF